MTIFIEILGSIGFYLVVGVVMSLIILSDDTMRRVMVEEQERQSLGIAVLSIMLLWPVYVWLGVFARRDTTDGG